MPNYQQDFGSVINTRTSFIDEIINLARKSSIFYLLFGLACCGIELMQTGGPRAGHPRVGNAPPPTPPPRDLVLGGRALSHTKGETRPPPLQPQPGPEEPIRIGV